MAKMKAVQVPKAGGDFEIVEREIPQPGAGQVRIRVQACGICHSDVVTKEGLFPGITYPRVPGHEVAGVRARSTFRMTEWPVSYLCTTTLELRRSPKLWMPKSKH